MKLYAGIFLFLFGYLQVAIPQVTPSDNEDPYGELIISGTLSLNGVSLSFTEKALNRLGDRAAIGLTRVIADKPPTQPEQVKAILSILRKAFTQPTLITLKADRQPKATLFLLNCLQNLTFSRDLTGEIKETRAFVLQKVSHD